MTDDPLRDLADRMFRQVLAHPASLRAFLHRVVPNLADHFAYDQLRVLDRELPHNDWRKRECDLLVELPFTHGAETEPVLVCVLIEHQSRSDWRMPLRTLVYTALYWDRQLREWEQRRGDKKPFRLTPVVPIVLYAAERPWGRARTEADLIDAPDTFRVFAPRWEPLFWELGTADVAELLDSREAFDQFLGMVRSEAGIPDDLEPIVREGLQRIRDQPGGDRTYTADMIRAVLTWLIVRRPADERDRWLRVAEEAVADADMQREIRTMGQIIAENIYERGRAAAAVETIRSLIDEAGRERFGEPTADQVGYLASTSDPARLKLIHTRLFESASWGELLRD